MDYFIKTGSFNWVNLDFKIIFKKNVLMTFIFVCVFLIKIYIYIYDSSKCKLGNSDTQN